MLWTLLTLVQLTHRAASSHMQYVIYRHFKIQLKLEKCR
jgi:hypothetical protein